MSWGSQLTAPDSPLSGNFGKVRFTPDGSVLVQQSESNGIRMWPVSGTSFGEGITLPAATITTALGTGTVRDIAIHPDGTHLLIATEGGLGYCTLDRDDGFGSITEFGTLTSVRGVAFSPDGQAFVYQDRTGNGAHAVSWSGGSPGSAINSVPTSGLTAVNAKCIDITRDGDHCVVANNNGALFNFNSTTGFGTQVGSTVNLGSSVYQVEISPGSDHFSAFISNAFYRVWPFSTSGIGSVISANAGVGNLRGAGWNHDGTYAFFGGPTSPRGKIIPFNGSAFGTALANPDPVVGSTPYGATWNLNSSLLVVNPSTSGLLAYDFGEITGNTAPTFGGGGAGGLSGLVGNGVF